MNDATEEAKNMTHDTKTENSTAVTNTTSSCIGMLTSTSSAARAADDELLMTYWSTSQQHIKQNHAIQVCKRPQTTQLNPTPTDG